MSERIDAIEPRGGVVLRGGTVIDSIGERQVDVRIVGDRIAETGDLPDDGSAEVIDATGRTRQFGRRWTDYQAHEELTNIAIAALWSAATAEPALKPNQPTHSMPAPVTVMVRLCGGMATEPKPRRGPIIRAATSAAGRCFRRCRGSSAACSFASLRSWDWSWFLVRSTAWAASSCRPSAGHGDRVELKGLRLYYC